MTDKRDRQLKFVVSEAEYNQIQINAAVCGKTITAYARDSLLNMANINVDYSIIENHTDVLIAIQNAIYQLLFYIRKNNGYTPKDIEYMCERITTALEKEEELCGMYCEHIAADTKAVQKELRKIAKRRLAK